MPIDPTALAFLQAASLTGRPACAEYLKVTWDATHISYYGSAAWQDEAPFTGIGHTIEARIMRSGNDPFSEFELCSDLTTDNIKFTFDDIPDKDTGIKPISPKFQAYGSGVQCELFYYYPNPTSTPITTSVWFGQLQAPQVYGWKQLECVATNGFKSRELLLPKRTRPRECTSNFGGRATAEAIQTMICPYDRHVGGSVGNYKTGTTPYTDCPRLTEADCIARLGADSRGRAKYFGGFVVDANAVAFPAHHDPGYVAVSEGNASKLSDPIRVIAGTMHARGLQLLLWSRITPPGVAHGFIDGVWGVGEGPVSSIYNVQVKDKIIEPINNLYRLGTRGQGNTGYAANGASNFSGTAVMRAVYGWVDSGTVDAGSLTGECDVVGYANVAVFDALGAYVRQWTANRVWWLLEMYSNQRWGMGYPFSRFTTLDFKTEADFSENLVNFGVTYPDGETRAFAHQRSSFNAIIEGRPCGDVIGDVCKSGGISVPFQNDGKFTVSSFRVATSGELAAARVFTDKGQNPNIVWDSGQPSIKLSQTPNDKVVNEVEVTFEDSANQNAARPITVDDPNQKLLAGRELGENNMKSVPKKFSAFGITTLAEAVKIAYRFLRFGESDSGGTHNNLQIVILTPFEQALGLKRYDIINVVSNLLTGFLSPEGAAFTYFRVLKLRKIAGNRCEITAQAYNHTAYTNFETVVVTHSCSPGQHWDYVTGACVADAPSSCAIGYHWDADLAACVPDVPIYYDPPCDLTISATYNATTNNIQVQINPC